MPLARSKAPQAEPLPFLSRRRDWRTRMRALLHRWEQRRHASSVRTVAPAPGSAPGPAPLRARSSSTGGRRIARAG